MRYRDENMCICVYIYILHSILKGVTCGMQTVREVIHVTAWNTLYCPEVRHVTLPRVPRVTANDVRHVTGPKIPICRTLIEDDCRERCRLLEMSTVDALKRMCTTSCLFYQHAADVWNPLSYPSLSPPYPLWLSSLSSHFFSPHPTLSLCYFSFTLLPQPAFHPSSFTISPRACAGRSCRCVFPHFVLHSSTLSYLPTFPVLNMHACACVYVYTCMRARNVP